MLLRDLIARITFQTDTKALRTLDATIASVAGQIKSLATGAFVAWAIDVGENLDYLNQQLRNVSSDDSGFDALQEKIKELSSDKDGLPSLFSEQTVTKAALNLRQLGFSSVESAKLLEESTLLMGRAGVPLDELAKELGSAFQTGGIADLLRRLGFYSRETAEDFGILESAVGKAMGELAPREQRRYRGALDNVIQSRRKQLGEELRTLEHSDAGAAMRLAAQVKNVWNEVATTLLHAVKDALNVVAGLTEKIRDLVRDIRKEWDNVQAPQWMKDMLEYLKRPTSNSGVPMPGDPLPWDAPTRSTAPQEREQHRQEQEQNVRNFGDVLRRHGVGPQQQGTTAPGAAKASGIMWNGDVHIHTQANNPDEVGRVVKAELKSMFRQAVSDLLPSTT